MDVLDELTYSGVDEGRILLEGATRSATTRVDLNALLSVPQCNIRANMVSICGHVRIVGMVLLVFRCEK